MRDKAFERVPVRQALRNAAAVMALLTTALAGLSGTANASVSATPAYDQHGEPNVDAVSTRTVRVPAHLVWVVKMYTTGCDILEFLQFPAVPGAVRYTATVVELGQREHVAGPPFEDRYAASKGYLPPKGTHQFHVLDDSIGGGPGSWGKECATERVKDQGEVKDPVVTATVQG
jgi:hypothetical protein